MFVRNVLTLMTGTMLAQLIGIVLSPILTRLYTPEDFGILAFFISIVSLISIIGTLRYEQSIMLPKKDIDSFYLFLISVSLSFIICSIVLILLFIFYEYIIIYFEKYKVGLWIYLIPVSAFLMSFFNSAIQYNNRKKFYKDISKISVVKSIILNSSQLLLGFFKFGYIGLIFSQIISLFFSNKKLLENIFFTVTIKKLFIKQKILILSKTYSNFPKYSLPMSVLNSLSTNFISYFLVLFFNSSLLGIYFLAERTINIPLGVLSGAFSSVFYQQLIEVKNKSYFLLKSYVINLILGIFILIPFVYFGEYLFSLIFGDRWEKSGMIAGIIAPLLVSSFATGSISNIFSFLQKNEVLLLWQFIYFLFFCLIVVFFKEDFYLMLKYLSIAGSFLYFILFGISFYLVREYEKN